jgi:hypothetical protein
MEFRSYSVFDHRQLLRKKLDPENSFQLVLAVLISTVGEKCCSSRKKHTSSTICVGTGCTIQNGQLTILEEVGIQG